MNPLDDGSTPAIPQNVVDAFAHGVAARGPPGDGDRFVRGEQDFPVFGPTVGSGGLEGRDVPNASGERRAAA